MKRKIKIEFGILKPEYKNNTYISLENSLQNTTQIVYAMSKDMLSYPTVYYINEDGLNNKMINLNYFESYKILEEIKN